MPELLRLLAEVGAAANWIAIFIAAVIAVFVLYLGIALRAVLRAPNKELGEIYLQAFRALLGWFDRGRR
jgi:hypothetical protein